jgi:hypothetical protein
MERCVLDIEYPAKQLASFPIKGNNLETWRMELLSKLEKYQKVQAVILILPGFKKS